MNKQEIIDILKKVLNFHNALHKTFHHTEKYKIGYSEGMIDLAITMIEYIESMEMN